MATKIYTVQDLINDLAGFDPDTPVIAQTCCYDDNAAAGGIQACTVLREDDGIIRPMPDDMANAIAVEIINVDA